MINNIASRLAVTLKTEMSASDIFPFSDRKKFPTKQFKPHMKNIAFNNNPIVVVSPTVQYFELGNDYAEKVAPYYHILEDAKVISNPNKGTIRSKGSQANVRPLSKRDYSVGSVDSSGYITPEYRGTFNTGKRSYWNAQRRLTNRAYETRNEKSKFRYNIHYAYIERILEKELPKIASLSGLRLLTSSKGLTLRETAPKEMRMDLSDLVAQMIGV
jgi:hypothetical protein